MGTHARQFLERVIPTIEVGQTAYINIHWASLAKGTDGQLALRNGLPFKVWGGRACESIDEAIRTLNWAASHGDKDLYVCMSTQSECQHKMSGKGHSYRNAVRLAEHATAIRSLFIDIDVKEGAYESTGAALAALKTFLDDTGLPNPTAVVASGSGGFHSHWAMDRNLTPEEWRVASAALAAAVMQHGLIADTQCTIDIARILRVPDTVNRKSDPPTPVTLMSLWEQHNFESIMERLQPYVGVLPVKVTGARIPENDDLGANLDESARLEFTVEDVAKQCPFVARTLGTGGADNAQPLWFLTGSLATFLEDGRAALHAMSSKHRDYTPAETDAMYDRAIKNQQSKDLGWPQCASIAGFGAKECQSCPLLVQGKSPLNFALTAAAKDTPVDTLPDKYFRTSEGLIHFRTIDEEGRETTMGIWGYPILNGWLSNDPWTFHFVSRSASGRRITMEIPTEVIFAREGLPKYLGSKGFFGTDRQYKLLKDFLVAWLQKLQQSKDSVISAAPFGWSVVDGKIEGFAYAGRVWSSENDRPAANPNPVLAYQYTPKGEPKHWKDLAQVIYEQKRPSLDAIIAVAFAAPLVRFTGFPGLLLNAYSSESGIGKTTAMKVSQAVWGHPVLAMQGLNDTTNSVLGKMGQIRSLPMYWDELKSDQQTKRFVSIVFDLTGGREKTRMNADTTLRLSGTWQTMLVSASNDSIIDAMAREVGSTTAGLHRLFEYTVPKPAKVTHDVGAVQRMTGKLEDNYGHAGLEYARFLGKHWQRAELEVAEKQDEICREIKVLQEERNWAATIAVVLKGAEYANELGMTQIDIGALKAFLLEVLARMREEVEASPSDLNNDMSVSGVLAEFFNSTRSRNTLITNRIWVARGKPPLGMIQVISDTNRLDEIKVQIGQDDKLIRISSVALSRWMADRGYSRHAFVKKLEKEFGMTKLNGKLGGGTHLTCATEHILELDGNDAKLSAFVDV